MAYATVESGTRWPHAGETTATSSQSRELGGVGETRRLPTHLGHSSASRSLHLKSLLSDPLRENLCLRSLRAKARCFQLTAAKASCSRILRDRLLLPSHPHSRSLLQIPASRVAALGSFARQPPAFGFFALKLAAIYFLLSLLPSCSASPMRVATLVASRTR